MKKLFRYLVVVLVIAQFGVVAASSSAPPAVAEDNGLGLTPMMGWSTWGPLGTSPSAALDEQAAQDLVSSGLSKLGYDYVDQDDFWYECPGSQGPDVNTNGFWVPNSNFPSGPNGENGIEVLASYVHSLGLKFGLYVTPGISKQAVAENVPILNADGVGDSGYTADEIAATSTSGSSYPGSLSENNYNCGGMVPLATTTNSSGATVLTQGAQDFLDSWANELASWGVDYLKVDGVGSFDIPDVVGWSQALQQTGRPILLALSNSLNIDYASTWAQYSNEWRTDGDIQCYCSSASHEETSWSSVESRFDQAAEWAPYGGPGAFNWLDDLVVGDSPAMTGLTEAQAEAMESLWALAASPLEIGVNLGDLTQQGLADLSNTAVIAVDQDGIDASRLVNTSTEQIFYKTEPSGDAVVGLFNISGQPEDISTSASALGLPSSTAYELDNLWAGTSTETAGVVEANVPSDGVALFRVTPISSTGSLPPSTTIGFSNLPSELYGGQPVTVTESITNNGVDPAEGTQLGLSSEDVSPATCNLCVEGPGALSATGNARVDVNGVIAAGATASSSVVSTGSSKVAGSEVYAADGTETTGTATVGPLAGWGTPGDPLSGLSPPALSGTASTLSATGSNEVTASPGVYSTLSASGAATLALSPGTYVVTGQLGASGSGKISGTGVSIYLACSSYPSPCGAGQQGGAVAASGDGQITLTGAPEGGLGQVAIFADPADASSVVASGSGSISLTGSLHGPALSLSATGNAALDVESGALVVGSAEATGSGSISVDQTSSFGPAPDFQIAAASSTDLGDVGSGQTAQATFQVTPAALPTGQLYVSGQLTASGGYSWDGTSADVSATSAVIVASPVEAPYETFSSAADAPAFYAEQGNQFLVSGAGADLFSDADAYSTIYLPGSMGLTSTAVTEVTSQDNLSGFAKAGIIVRNSMTGSGTTPEGVILFESPSGGFQLEWDSNGGDYINSVTPANGTFADSLPVYLMLQRTDGDVYTGYYSYDGSNWFEVGSVTVPDQADGPQDAGIFVTSHAAGDPGTAIFNGFSVTSGATPPPLATLYMANSADFSSSTELESCSTCYYGEDKVGFVGEGGTVTFDDVVPPSAGSYNLTIIYGDGSAAAGAPGRPGEVSVDGGTPEALQFTATGSYTVMGAMTVPVTLQAGSNTIELEDPSAYMPDIDAIAMGFPSTVQPPYESFSSATDSVAQFRQQGTEFGISGAGAGLYSGDDDYSTIYSPSSMGVTSTAEVEVVSQENMNGYAKAGILVRNDMTDAGSATSPEGVTLFESPSGGVQMEWDNDGGEYINDVSPGNGTIADPLTGSTPTPVYLMLQRTDGDVYTGYYSTNGTTWAEVASETIPDQATGSQDTGMFVTSGDKGDPATVDFSNFSVTAGATPP